MLDTKKYLGARIQEIRKEKGIKQAEFAEMIGIDAKHLSKIECGRCYPSFELLDRIANKMELPVSYFLETDHLISSEDLILKTTELLQKISTDKLRKIYKILNEFI